MKKNSVTGYIWGLLGSSLFCLQPFLLYLLQSWLKKCLDEKYSWTWTKMKAIVCSVFRPDSTDSLRDLSEKVFFNSFFVIAETMEPLKCALFQKDIFFLRKEFR